MHDSPPIPHEIAANAWSRIQGELAQKLPSQEYDVYVSPCRFFAYEDGEMIVSVPHAVAQTFLNNRYRAVIKRSLAAILGRAVEVRFVVDSAPQDAGDEHSPTPIEGAVLEAETDPGFDARPAGPAPKLNPLYTFREFVQGEHNQLAWAAAKSLADHPDTTYMPLYIYGDVGLGKTHLLHAIGHVVHAQRRRVALCTTEQFLNDLVASIRHDQMDSFRARYREVDLFLLDDVQFLTGRERTQEEVFFTFSALFEQGKRVVLTSDCPPKQIKGLEQRLRSRFAGGLLVDIGQPEYETRLAILQQKVALYRYDIPMSLLHPIAQHVQDNIRVLEGVLHTLNHLRLHHNAPLTEQQVYECLGEMAPNDAPLEPDALIASVAAFFDLTPAALKGPSRKQPLSHARQVAMYLLRHDARASLPRIGDMLGGRDHTTVSHGIERVAARLPQDDELARALGQIRGQCRVGA